MKRSAQITLRALALVISFSLGVTCSQLFSTVKVTQQIGKLIPMTLLNDNKVESVNKFNQAGVTIKFEKCYGDKAIFLLENNSNESILLAYQDFNFLAEGMDSKSKDVRRRATQQQLLLDKIKAQFPNLVTLDNADNYYWVSEVDHPHYYQFPLKPDLPINYFRFKPVAEKTSLRFIVDLSNQDQAVSLGQYNINLKYLKLKDEPGNVQVCYTDPKHYLESYNVTGEMWVCHRYDISKPTPILPILAQYEDDGIIYRLTDRAMTFEIVSPTNNHRTERKASKKPAPRRDERN